MKVVVQRCSNAHCTVNETITGKIDRGLMILVGFTEGDTEETIETMAQKIVNLRIFDDENGVMNLSLLDIDGSILSISQFTLYADTHKGHRPSYMNAMKGEKAVLLYEKLNQVLSQYTKVETGIFGADMKVTFTNDGPVTIILER